MPNNNGSDRENGSQPIPVVGKRPTREDLTKTLAAMKESSEATAAAAETVLAAMEGGESMDDPDSHGEYESMPGEEGGGGQGNRINGPAAQATGHGSLAGGLRRVEGPAAFEQFMAALKRPLKNAGQAVRVSENRGWIKIEGRQGHKVYIAKTKTGVSRIESTLDPDLIKGAAPPDVKNGRIASWIPATPEAVSEAIGLLVKLEEPLPPPRRGNPSGR